MLRHINRNNAVKFICRWMPRAIFLVMVLSLVFSFSLFVAAVTRGVISIRSLTNGLNDSELILHALHVMELLLLAPLPFMIGMYLYNWSVDLQDSDAAAQDAGSNQNITKRSGLSSVKRFMFGLMISVVGVVLVEKVLKGEQSLSYYIGGAITIVTLTLFYTVLGREIQKE